MQPSEQLVAAADLIRDLAVKATDGPWTFDDSTVDGWLGRWIHRKRRTQ